MSDASLLGPPRIQRRLAAIERKSLNFDLAMLERASPATGWTITDLCQPLPDEPPGKPVENGSWQIARALMSGYEFADPSIVRAYYDPDVPLEHRNMLLRLRALGIVHVDVGVRVGQVYDETRRVDRRTAYVWGWNYRTLEGHVEMGQMDWQVWKWPDQGAVEFRVHAVSRPAPIRNPIVSLGFRLLRERERAAFLHSTKVRMRTFTALALSHERPECAIRKLGPTLTARRTGREDAAHRVLAESARDR